MRLGLLGPAVDQRDALEKAALGLRDRAKAERVVYLGADSALDDLVLRMAERLVGPRAEDAAWMSRATATCLNGTPEEIRDFLRREKERSSLRMFESLAGETTRSVELIGGKVAVMLHDKGDLVEDDILPATLLIFGRSREMLIKPIGRRWFLSPGVFPKCGIMVIEEEEGVLSAIAYDADFNVRQKTTLEAPKTLRMRVAGAS